jgi:hypothetical protein
MRLKLGNATDFLQFVWLCCRCYRQAKSDGGNYFAITRFGVPQVACFVATGRNAWRVSKLAVETKLMN